MVLRVSSSHCPHDRKFLMVAPSGRTVSLMGAPWAWATWRAVKRDD
jgi:hypothetical protein